jgi:hypothetical protein
MADSQGSSGGEGLSLQTLVIAALASGAAAVIVSKIWADGTVIAAAMTPVIVSVVKEALKKPMESEIVKRPVQRIASGSRVVVGGASRTVRSRPSSGVGRQTYEPPVTSDGRSNGSSTAHGDGAPPHLDPDHPAMGPVSTYGRPKRRRPSLKLAIVTGLLAFVIAAVVLTVPELLFGGSVAGSDNSSTTLFGGSTSDSKSEKQKAKDKANKNGGDSKGSTTKPEQNSPQSTTPATPPSGKTPTTEQTTPTDTEPAPPPSQTSPPPTSPVPQTPTPPSP